METKTDEKEKEIMAKEIEIKRREKEKRNMEKKGSRDLKEKDEKIEDLRREVEQRRVQVEEVEESLQMCINGYQRQIHALKAKILRIPSRLATATNCIARTFNDKADEERTFFLKDSNGIIPDETQDIFLDLVAMDAVPANKVTQGDLSCRSVGRIVKEGGNASKLQIIESLKDAKGITLSGDGTTHKNETYESKFATVITPNKKLQFFLGLKMAVNHTSEMQLAGWIETTEDLFHLAYESGLISEDDARIFWNLVTGFHSDHAADQKKLFELLKKWKTRLEHEVQGERAVKRLTNNEYACLIFQGSQVLVQKAGGPVAWDALGETEFEKLSEAEKAEIDLILWAGCCMHKEMNTFKGGCVSLDEYWNGHPDLPPPILLPNRDNAAAIEKAPGTEAAERATARSERGAIKFLTYVQHNKGTGKLNHMEQNVLAGLNDPPTCQEFCVITLYWLAISVPYMREIRGPHAKEDNILRLGDFYQHVIDHIDTLIKEPERLLGPDASAARGSLDGLAWERPDVFYAAQKHTSEWLPQIRNLLVHFLKRAKDSWLRFISEFKEGGSLSCATPEQIECAWMEKTNDLNEGAFGTYRQTSHANPTLSLTQYNAQQMFKFNQTSAYLHTLNPAMRQWLRKITCTQDASGDNHRERIQMAQHCQEVAEKKIEKDTK
ncbi:hypothetical protein EV359DRAFT_65570 [Lentinula novae-zelandiae]|nr:hypothetical protein EV359DRAFT_65570 [Lentinula novae-zelandiae]